MCWGSRSPGWAGGSIGLRGGFPSPPPLPGGAGALRAGWEAPGAAAAPRPSRRSGCGTRPRLCQASGARSRPVTSCRAERVGDAGWGLRAGLEEGASGEVLPGQPDPSPGPPPPLGALLPLPPRVPRFLPAPVAMTTPLPGLCALGPGVFSPLSLFLLFFSLLSSEFCSPVGATKLRKCWPLVGKSPLTERERGMREGREVT